MNPTVRMLTVRKIIIKILPSGERGWISPKPTVEIVTKVIYRLSFKVQLSMIINPAVPAEMRKRIKKSAIIKRRKGVISTIEFPEACCQFYAGVASRLFVNFQNVVFNSTRRDEELISYVLKIETFDKEI